MSILEGRKIVRLFNKFGASCSGIVVVFYILFLGCNDNANRYRRVYEPIGDSIRVREYYCGEVLWRQYSVIVKGKDTIRHGLYFEYYPNGNLKKSGRYKEGYKEDIWLEYYSHGIEKFIIKYVQDRPFTHMYFLDSRGDIAHYYFFNFSGSVITEFAYYDNNNRVDIIGKTLSLKYLNSQRLRVGDTAEITVYPLMPPYFDVEIYAKLVGYHENWDTIYIKHDIMPDTANYISEELGFITKISTVSMLVFKEVLRSEKFRIYKENYDTIYVEFYE